MSDLIVVSEEEFEPQVIEATVPVLIDFYAPWCGPCKPVTKILEKLADVYEGRIKIVKVNVDEEAGLTARNGVAGLPTLSIVVDGQVRDMIMGNISEARIKEFLYKNIGGRV